MAGSADSKGGGAPAPEDKTAPQMKALSPEEAAVLFAEQARTGVIPGQRRVDRDARTVGIPPAAGEKAAPAPASSADARTLAMPSSADAKTISQPSSPDARTLALPGSPDAATIRPDSGKVSPDSGTVRMDSAKPATADSGTVRMDAPAPAGPFAQRSAKTGRASHPSRGGGQGAPTEEIDEFGPYKVTKELGRGGMGVVYKAHHRTLNRDVALKVMLGGEIATDQDIRRFLREAEACAALKHPNIVPVHDIGQQEGKYYFSMEFVEGETLLDWGKRQKRTPDEVTAIMRKVCEAIAYAHQRGIIHRDLKPHNVMVDASGEPKVMDFGLAKRTDGGQAVPGAEKTVVGTIMGTPQYMPPEQASGRVDEVDTRSDVYALGVILFELLAGVLPINADTLQELLLKIETQDPPPLRQKAPHVAWELEVVTTKCLQKEKPQRYQSAQELADDLGRYLRKEPILARRASIVYRAKKMVQRHRTGTAVLLTFLVAGTAGGTYLVRESQRRAREGDVRLGAALRAADDAVGELRTGLDAFEKDAPALDGKARDARLTDLVPRRKDVDAKVAAAETVADDVRPEAHELVAAKAKNQADRLEALEKQTDALLKEQLLLEARQKEAVQKIAEGRAKRASVKPEAIETPKDAEGAASTLALARRILFKAQGLDDRNPDAERELNAVVEVEKAVAARADVLNRAEQVKEALGKGRELLREARAVRDQKLYATDEDAQGDETLFAYEKAITAFGTALTYDRDNPDARSGWIDGLLESAVAAAEDRKDFTAVRIAAFKIGPLAPEKVARARAAVDRIAALAQNYDKVLADARADRTRGAFKEAAAGFERALSIYPSPEVEFAYRMCAVRVAGDEARHADALSGLAGAERLAGEDAAQRAEVDAERKRILDALVDLAEKAVAAGDMRRAAGYAEEVLRRRPDDARARQVRIEVGGRQSSIEGMIFVSAGAISFTLDPKKEAVVPAFFVGAREVTNAEFQRFVDAGGYASPEVRATGWPKEARPLLDAGRFVGRDGKPGPAGWVGGKPPAGTERRPVAGVSWYEASAYASWAGMRLPAEAEWERAALVAAGDRAVRAPWGAADWPRWARCFDRPAEGTKDAGEPYVLPDGTTLQDRAASGALDMYGNVHEWVAASAGPRVVARGGSFLSRLPGRSSPARRFLARPDFRAEHVGFRLAADAKE